MSGCDPRNRSGCDSRLGRGNLYRRLVLGTLRTIDIPRLQTTVPIHVLYRKNGYLSGASRTLLSLSALLQFARLLLRIKIGSESHPRDNIAPEYGSQTAALRSP
jgi:hypothetical protein